MSLGMAVGVIGLEGEGLVVLPSLDVVVENLVELGLVLRTIRPSRYRSDCRRRLLSRTGLVRLLNLLP
jgi:hypothetical protein